MRTRPIAALALCSLLLGGCHSTRSGAAINHRLGVSLQRMLSAPGQLALGEGRRTRQLLQAVSPDRWLDPVDLQRSIDGAGARLAHSLRHLQALPGSLAGTGAATAQRMTRNVQRLAHPRPGDLHNPERLGRKLGNWHRGLPRLPEFLGIAHPILPGPGDQDRTTDPYQVGRQLTWVERLLLRF